MDMKIEKRTVGARGQIVLPKRLREHFNLKPGKKVVFEVKQGAIILKPELEPRRFIEEFISAPNKLKKIAIKDIKEVLESEYETLH